MKLMVLSTVLYAIFAFVTTIVALNIFWPAGLALGIVLGWRGGFIAHLGAGTGSTVQSVVPTAPNARGTGNASFDAYRIDMLTRLEQEQDKFEGFLGRLREAKDKTEFDRFMEERARAASAAVDAPQDADGRADRDGSLDRNRDDRGDWSGGRS